VQCPSPDTLPRQSGQRIQSLLSPQEGARPEARPIDADSVRQDVPHHGRAPGTEYRFVIARHRAGRFCIEIY